MKSSFSSEQKELAAGVLKQAALTDEPTQMSALYQISTSTALVEGVYSGSIPSSVLLSTATLASAHLLALRELA
jgi:hypothetical protein